MQFLAPTAATIRKDPSIHSGSDAGGSSYLSDSSDDDGVFSPMPVMSPMMVVRLAQFFNQRDLIRCAGAE
jgi:hypothetical protein